MALALRSWGQSQMSLAAFSRGLSVYRLWQRSRSRHTFLTPNDWVSRFLCVVYFSRGTSESIELGFRKPSLDENKTVEKTVTYLHEFKPQAAEWFSKADFVQANVAFFKEFFARENLETIEWSRIQKMGEHLHCFGSMQIAKANALGKPNHSIEHYRKSFLFLAHGSGTAAERVRKFWKDKEYRLDYFGHSAISELAGYLFPDEFMFVNARDKFAAKFLGIDVETPTGADFGVGAPLVTTIVSRMTALNKAIEDDVKNLGSGYRIGHSFFCPYDGIKPDEHWFCRVITAEIIPLLEEYWCDNEQKADEHRANLLEGMVM